MKKHKQFEVKEIENVKFHWCKNKKIPGDCLSVISHLEY